MVLWLAGEKEREERIKFFEIFSLFGWWQWAVIQILVKSKLLQHGEFYFLSDEPKLYFRSFKSHGFSLLPLGCVYFLEWEWVIWIPPSSVFTSSALAPAHRSIQKIFLQFCLAFVAILPLYPAIKQEESKHELIKVIKINKKISRTS